MPLEFRGIAIVDPPGRGIRFAGYPTSGQREPIIICEVSGQALKALSGITGGKPDDLTSIFDAHKEIIFKIASRKFDEGDFRPKVDVSDLQKVSSK